MPGIPQISIGTSSDKIKDTDAANHDTLTRNGTISFHSSNRSSIASNGFWSKHSDNVSYDRLQKFWCELTPQARRNLLKIDKQTLFEHARKNMYCSRCNGLLLEGFFQIVMYGKSQQPNLAGGACIKGTTENDTTRDLFGPFSCQDLAAHPWGGLTTTRDGMLTLLDHYFYSKSLRDLQNLFESARARERERELLYPDACGGGARGWISQGNGGYGRIHGTRESCALHTAKLSVETLVDFWSALGEETRQSLLKMKEEDFVERLMHRFDNKRFCRDCRKNVIREFKELKEMERLHRQTRCTSWFCVADTAFEYEVTQNTVQLDWHEAFSDAVGKYHHFEWAIGTGEGKSDILEFKNVGLNRSIQANGLDLTPFNSCHITVRAWRADGRCDELCVKAHALQGQQCVHCRLVVCGGFVTIARGESITRLFEHAEEAEEEEDDDFMDKEGSDLDGECFRPQKHAKSPELAREFLLDAATIIFKEQVEKAFREGTARQNSHSVLICLALKLLEERAHIACKEIITFEKQMKLLEEEEKEKREKEERKEQRRTKEKEKKLRRKERLRGRENLPKNSAALDLNSVAPDDSKDDSKECFEDVDAVGEDMSHETGNVTSSGLSLNVEASEYGISYVENASEDNHDEENGSLRSWSESSQFDDVKYSRTKKSIHRNYSQDSNVKSTYRRRDGSFSESKAFGQYETRYHVDDAEHTRSSDGWNKQVRGLVPRPGARISGGKHAKFQYTIRSAHRYDSQSCSCKPLREYRPRGDLILRQAHDPKCANRIDVPSDIAKPYYQDNNYPLESAGQAKGKAMPCNTFNVKKVWEPLDSRKKITCSHSDSDVTLRSAPKVEISESSSTSSDDLVDISVQTIPDEIMNVGSGLDSVDKDIPECFSGNVDPCSVTRTVCGASSDMSITTTSSSDNSSCLSEVDSSISSSPQNMEPESTSDSEDCGHTLDTRTFGICLKEADRSKGPIVERQEPSNFLGDFADKSTLCFQHCGDDATVLYEAPPMLPQMQIHNVELPVFHAPSMDYYHQGPGCWPSHPTSVLHPFPISNPYMLPSTYGYDFNGNPQFMAYGPLQHMNPVVFSHPSLPVFQPISSQVNKANPSPQILENAASLSFGSSSPQAVVAEQNVKEKADAEHNNGFSLFHFGGPIADSTAQKSDPAPTAGKLANPSVDSVGERHSCSEEDSLQQQKLYDCNNGVRFSIF